jgi:hypothetical protein
MPCNCPPHAHADQDPGTSRHPYPRSTLALTDGYLDAAFAYCCPDVHTFATDGHANADANANAGAAH